MLKKLQHVEFLLNVFLIIYYFKTFTSATDAAFCNIFSIMTDFIDFFQEITNKVNLLNKCIVMQ